MSRQASSDLTYDILIPAYNAGDSIGRLLQEIFRLPVRPGHVWVIDDGSTDRTAAIASESGAEVIRLERNRGKGAALELGFSHFLQHSDSGYLLCMDADLQHPAASIPDFVSRAAQPEGGGFIIGNRRKSYGAMPVHRIFSNVMTSYLLSRITGQRIRDSQCGFRLIHRSVLDDLHMTEKGYQLESEMIILAARQGIPISFVDIPTIYNSADSHIGHVMDTMRFIRLIMRHMRRAAR